MLPQSNDRCLVMLVSLLMGLSVLQYSPFLVFTGCLQKGEEENNIPETPQ